MKIFLKYLNELWKETFPLILFLLGLFSKLSSYFLPSLNNYINFGLVGWICILAGFVYANFRIYKKYAPIKSQQAFQDLLGEIRYNLSILDQIKYSTAPTLRDEIWRLVSEKVLDVSVELRTDINEVYRRIRSAKEIHLSIQGVEQGNTVPELIDIEKHLESAKKTMHRLVEQLDMELQKISR